MQNERIIEVLEEVYREEISGGDEGSFESLLEEFNTTRDPELPVYWIPETIIGAVEKLTGRKFGWYVEALRDEFSLSGEFAFILVNPLTHRCLTASTDTDGNCTVCVIVPITNIDDAVNAVLYFLNLLEQERK